MADEKTFKKGIEYLEYEEWDRAIQFFTRMINRNPNNADALGYRGVAYAIKKEFKQAMKDCNEAVRLEPNNAKTYNCRGIAYRHKGEFDLAIQDHDKAIELDSEYPRAYQARGSAHFEKQDFNKAIEDHNKAIRLKPDYWAAYHSRGFAYQKKIALDQAIEDYSKTIEINSNYAPTYYNRGNIYYMKGNFNRAIKDYNKAIEIRPDHEDYYSALGLIAGLKKGETVEQWKEVKSFKEEHRKQFDDYEEIEKELVKTIKRSLWNLGIVSFGLTVALTLLVVFKQIEPTPLVLLPWILLIGFILSPIVWFITYSLGEKRRAQILKLYYKHEEHLEARWRVLPSERQRAIQEKLMERGMEKGPAEQLTILLGKGESHPAFFSSTEIFNEFLRRMDRKS